MCEGPTIIFAEEPSAVWVTVIVTFDDGFGSQWEIFSQNGVVFYWFSFGTCFV